MAVLLTVRSPSWITVLADDVVTVVLSQLCQGLKVSLAVLAKGEVLPADEGLHVESFGEPLHEFSSP